MMSRAWAGLWAESQGVLPLLLPKEASSCFRADSISALWLDWLDDLLLPPPCRAFCSCRSVLAAALQRTQWNLSDTVTAMSLC